MMDTISVPERIPEVLQHNHALRPRDSKPLHKVVVAHIGARDGYQVARGLEDAGLLDALVTDLYWNKEALAKLHRVLPESLLNMLRRRHAPGILADHVRTVSIAGLGGVILDRLPSVPFAVRRWLTRTGDAMLGHAAGREAKRRDATLLSYSYTGYEAFRTYGPGGILFQVHPHPVTMRRILREELERFPDSAQSLLREWELSLPEKDFKHLVAEPAMASHFLAASSFTRDTLVEHGAKRHKVCVVPYGVDALRFQPDDMKSLTRANKLRLLFVGRVNQRKGIRYLLQALSLLNTVQVELMIVGRIVDDHHIFEPYQESVKLHVNVTSAEIVQAYQSADLFVFPSVGEGFGHVLLEAMASGLPVLTTTHTAGPDLIDEGIQGFCVPPRRPDLLAERIEWATSHRSELAEMGRAARQRALEFPWQRFRDGVVDAVRAFQHSPEITSRKEAA